MEPLEDPFETRDLGGDRPEVAAALQRDYDAWFADVTAARDYTDTGVARIAIGAPQENPVRLNRQDWRGPKAGWTPASIGHWLVDVRRRGAYTITMRIAPAGQAGQATLTDGRRDHAGAAGGRRRAGRHLPRGHTGAGLSPDWRPS